MLDCPIEKAVAKLPLIEDIKSALVSRMGPAGQALRCAIAYESADWENVQFYGVAPAVIRDSYVEAIAWARNLTTGMLSN